MRGTCSEPLAGLMCLTPPSDQVPDSLCPEQLRRTGELLSRTEGQVFVERIGLRRLRPPHGTRYRL